MIDPPGDANRADRPDRSPQQLAIQMMEWDRLRWSCELHDGLIQSIVAAQWQVEACAASWRCGRALTEEDWQQISLLLQRAATDGRRWINQLRSGWDSPTDPLEVHLQQLVASFREAYPGIEWQFDWRSPSHAPEPSSDLSLTMLRIAEEALRNAAQHSHSPQVRIEVSWDPSARRFLLEIEDHGRGFDATSPPPGHFGVRGMTTRAQLVGGRIEILSAPQSGTRIRFLGPSHPA
ncbi:MAG: sensor histidine kinase [Pirellulaceae bacterium]|jgi:signal transduction histidine kinase